MQLSKVVLPAPEGPVTAMQDPGLAKSTDKWQSPTAWFRTISNDMRPPIGAAPDEPFADHQRGQG